MSYANINDPNAVSALLDQLSASKAWKDALASQPPPPPTATAAAESGPSEPSSVAALLSQLQPSNAQLPRSAPPAEARIEAPISAQQTRCDLKVCTFQQALPAIATLSSDPAFIIQLQKLKEAQDDLEHHLWKERRAIERKYEEKAEVTKKKGSMIGVISKHEADRINDAYRKEVEKFDVERALPAFDRLVAKQQATLAELNVPTMYVTEDKATREGQQRIMQVLEGLVKSVETPCSEP